MLKWDNSSALDNRKAYDLGCDSGPYTWFLCRVLHCQQSNHARCSSPDIGTEEDRQVCWNVQHVRLLSLLCVETAGVWHEISLELTQEISRRITTVKE